MQSIVKYYIINCILYCILYINNLCYKTISSARLQIKVLLIDQLNVVEIAIFALKGNDNINFYFLIWKNL